MEQSQFEAVHKTQLQSIGFPPSLVPCLFSKLSSGKPENLDEKFELCPDKQRALSACGSVLKCAQPLPALSDVFVLQHLWESDGGVEAREALLKDPVLLVKVEGALGIVRRGGGEEVGGVTEEMVKVVCEQSGKSKVVSWKSLTDTGYDLIAAITLARQLSEEDALKMKKSQQPILTKEEFRRGLAGLTSESVPETQLQAMYNDWKDKKSREPLKSGENWVHCGSYRWREEEDNVVSVAIPLPPNTKKKDVLSDVTSKWWKFGVRGSKLIIDGQFFGRVVPDECFWTVEEGCVSVSVQACEGGWGELIVGEVQREVRGEGEKERAVMMAVDEVLARMWHVNQTYTAVTCEGKQCPVWYMMEPHGLALTHSQTPNFACHPFANALTGSVMSLLWPIRDVEVGDVCSRDYVPPLFPGETQSSRRMRERLIMAFGTQSRHQDKNVTTTTPPLSHPPPLPTSPPSHPPPSTPVQLYVSTNRQSAELEQMCPEGYTVCASPEQADLLLGYHELLPSPLLMTVSCILARLDGDHVLVHKTHFCRLVRGISYCVQGIDVRSEVNLLESSTATALTKGVVGSWYLVAPDGPWSAVPHHITNHHLEIVRLGEVGPAVATQFLQCTVLFKGQSCCLQYSVVVVAGEGGSLSAYLHPQPRVRLATTPCTEDGFQPWNTSALISSASCHVEWSEFLSSLMATEWSQYTVTEAVSALFRLALPKCKGQGAVYSVDILLLHRTQLVPLIIGVDPTPSFASSPVAKECLDLLSGQSGPDNFVSL